MLVGPQAFALHASDITANPLPGCDTCAQAATGHHPAASPGSCDNSTQSTQPNPNHQFSLATKHECKPREFPHTSSTQKLIITRSDNSLASHMFRIQMQNRKPSPEKVPCSLSDATGLRVEAHLAPPTQWKGFLIQSKEVRRIWGGPGILWILWVETFACPLTNMEAFQRTCVFQKGSGHQAMGG